MKFILGNQKWPPVCGSWVATNIDEQLMICLVDSHKDSNNVILVMLNRRGKLILNKNDSWFLMDANNTPSIRHNFEVYDKCNMPRYVFDHRKKI